MENSIHIRSTLNCDELLWLNHAEAHAVSRSPNLFNGIRFTVGGYFNRTNLPSAVI